MLQQIRDRAHGFIAWIVVILICIPFALWGVHEYLGPDPNVPVMEVDGEEVTLTEYRAALQQTRAALERQFGGRDVSRFFGEGRIREQALESLVGERLLVRAADEAGFTISDEQLARAIRSVPAFQREGAFSTEEYGFVLRRSGLTPGRFEDDTRRRLLEEQLRTALLASAVVPEARAARLAALEAQRREFSGLTIPASRFEDEVEVPEEDAARRYEENRAAYMTPEEVRLRYVVLSRDALAAEVEVPEELLRERYEGRKAGFTVEEQRRVSHILVAVDDAAAGGGEGEAAARARVQELRARIVAGEAFEDVAREASEDPGSAASGGDLGYGGRGIWVPAFEEAAFSLPVGELSEPVRSTFGFHLIQVADVRESRVRTFEEAREELEREYREDEADQAYFEQLERLSNLAFEQPDNLDDAADLLGLALEESGFVSRRGEAGHAVLGDPAALAAAFGEDVLAGNNSEVVELEGYRAAVLRVEEHREPRQRSLDEVREEIVAALRAERTAEAARAAGRELLGRLRSGEAMDEAAGDLAWSERRTAGRDDPELRPAVRGVLFAMPHPETGARPVFDGVATAGGGFEVLALHRVVEGEEGEEGEASAPLDTLRDELSQQSGLQAYEAFLAGLRERAEVRIFEERLANEDYPGEP